MPLLVPQSAPVHQLRKIRVSDVLPLFNAGDPAFLVTGFEGWYSTAVPSVVLVPTGGGPGAAAVGDWEPQEAYYALTGSVRCSDHAQLEWVRSMLLAAMPAHREVAIAVLDDRAGVQKQIFVRRYDKPDIAPHGLVLPFTFPLVAPDPYKYSLEPVSGEMGVFSGQTWFREYDPVTYHRTYSDAGDWVRTYEQSIPTGPFPPSLTLTSTGDAPSARMVATVNGPLLAGDWWLLNETTGRRLWAELGINAGQSLVFDMQAKTARLNGSPVDHLVFGDWLALQPGANTYRLVSGTGSDAYASIEALEAHQ